MKWKMLTLLLTLSAFFAKNSVDGVIVRFMEERMNGLYRDEKHGSISCGCEGFSNTFLPLPSSHAEEIFNGILNHSFCGENYPTNVCDLLKVCKNCTVQFEKCSPGNKRSKNICIKKRFEIRELFSIIDDSSDVGDDSSQISRFKRDLTGCPYPTYMRTADVECINYPSSMKCTVTCIFGHTLSDGTSKQLQCSKKKGKWKPSGFRECEPYIDCSVTLVSTGSVDCYTGTTKTAPHCNIACEHYEDRQAVPRDSYECKEDGSWSKSLPFCVIHGSGLELVPRPVYPLSKSSSKGKRGKKHL